MASKYAGLKGRIPEQEKPLTDRDQAIIKEMAEHAEKSLAELAVAYNAVEVQIEAAALVAAGLKHKQDALEILIRKTIDGNSIEKIGLDGFTWSNTYEPFPVADDPAAAVQYFKDNGMEDQLKLTASEVASRLKKHVKEEALANELEIIEKVVEGPDGPVTTTEVRSKIPGVKVFLKPSLSRVKSTANKRS